METGASTGTVFSEVVAKVADKLEIRWALLAKTSTEIHKLSGLLADPDVFAAWREECQTTAVYIVALTRVERTSRKKTAA